MPQITVQEFFDHVGEALQLAVHAGAGGLNRVLKSARIQKPSLALVGYSAFVHPDRVQILGQTELSFFQTLSPQAQARAASTLGALDLACIIVTKGLPLPEILVEQCDAGMTPLFRTSMASSECIRKVHAYLDDLLSPRCQKHGVLVDVSGIGVLITGASGIGKSECALELVMRGHRLVADDVVEIRRRGEDLVGQASKIIQDLIEIRGLGILNVAELYGVAATRDHKRIELLVELEEWRADQVYDRIGIDDRMEDILGVKVRSLLLPVRPGRTNAGIVEVAAKNFLLRVRGHDAPRNLNERILAEVHARRQPKLGPPGTPIATVARWGPMLAGGTPSLSAAADLADVTDHIEDEVE